MLAQLIAAGVFLAVMGLMVAALTRAVKRGGEKEAEAEAKEATIEAITRANEGAAEAVRDLRKGESPAKVKAKNDAKWGRK